MAPLPVDRVVHSEPFSVIGLDYTGAISVRDNNTVRKAYIVLYTCAVTRALHLELVENNSENEFLNAFRRYVARRGYPKTIISDNAKTFVAANSTLRDISNHVKIGNFLSEYRIEWKFIPARGSWFGGFYERLIGLVKSSIKKVLGKNLVTLNELRTLIVEVECRLNNRPLTYVSNDLGDPPPLSPAHLLSGYKPKTLPNTVDKLEIEDLEFNGPKTLRMRLEERM